MGKAGSRVSLVVLLGWGSSAAKIKDGNLMHAVTFEIYMFNSPNIIFMCWVFSPYDHKSVIPAVTRTGLWFLWSSLKDTSILMKLMPLTTRKGY